MRSFRHLTPRYIRNRLALMAFEHTNPNAPWLTRDMVNILNTWLRPTDVGLEFGSGRSTIWFASRVGHLTSVEDNPKWYKLVRNQIRDEHVEYFLHEDGAKNSADSDYVSVARRMASRSLDFCLVDGTARDHCALVSLDKLKPGGILIIDNVERYIPRKQKSYSPCARGLQDGFASDEWEQVGEQVKDWRSVWTTNGVTDTAFWIRPLTD